MVTRLAAMLHYWQVVLHVVKV